MSTKNKEEKKDQGLVHPILNAFMEHIIVEKGLAENTIVAYNSNLLNFFSFLKKNNIELFDTTENILFLYLTKRKNQDELSAKSLAQLLATLRNFFAYTFAEKFLDSDPAVFLENPKLPRTLPHILTQQEINRLLSMPSLTNKLGVRDRAILELLYAAGLRVSELCDIILLDFDPQTNLLRIFGKGSKERLVPIHFTAASYLNEYINNWRSLFNSKVKNIFLNRSGKALTRQGIWKMIKQRTIEAGIQKKVYPHIFRHSFATHLLDGGADLRTVQTLLGHVDINATEIYTHVQQTKLNIIHKNYHPRANYEH